jgi:hypothetical protein
VTGSIDLTKSFVGVGVACKMLAIFLLQLLYRGGWFRRVIKDGRASFIQEHEEGKASIDISY